MFSRDRVTFAPHLFFSPLLWPYLLSHRRSASRIVLVYTPGPSAPRGPFMPGTFHLSRYVTYARPTSAREHRNNRACSVICRRRLCGSASPWNPSRKMERYRRSPSVNRSHLGRSSHPRHLSYDLAARSSNLKLHISHTLVVSIIAFAPAEMVCVGDKASIPGTESGMGLWSDVTTRRSRAIISKSVACLLVIPSVPS